MLSMSHRKNVSGDLTDGGVFFIDDELTRKKWSEAGNEPEFTWTDDLSDRPLIRSVVSEGHLVLCSTRAGQVFRLIEGQDRIPLTNGPRAVTKWITEDDLVKSAVSRNGQAAVAGSKNGTLVLFDMKRSEHYETGRIHGHESEISGLAMNSDGTLLVSADKSGSVKFWNHSDGKLNLLFEMDHLMNPAFKLAFTPDDREIYMLCAN
jgi:WD40 repeat protein